MYPLYTNLLTSACPPGTTHEDRVYRDQVPALATRSLHKDQRFSLAKVDNNFLKGRQSSLYLKSEIVASYLIHYVYGFSSEGFSYFLTVQGDMGTPQRQVSKIAQVCQNDSFFYSYADIPLICTKNNVDYNVLETARVIKPGEELAKDLFPEGIPGDILIGVFTSSTESGVDSAICVYTVKEIRAKCLDNILQCHMGNSSVSGGGYLRVGPRGNCNYQVRDSLPV